MPPVADETGKEEEFKQGAVRQFPKSKPKQHGWQQKMKEDLDAVKKAVRKQDMEAMREAIGVDHDVAEVFSPPRVSDAALQLGMRPGYSRDLTVPGPDGKVWDFSRWKDRTKV